MRPRIFRQVSQVRIRLWYFLVTSLTFLSLAPQAHANAENLELHKIGELYVAGFNFPDTERQNISTWTQTQKGYILRTPAELFFYTPDLELVKTVPISQKSPHGSWDMKVVNDTLLCVLDLRSVTLYSMEGEPVRKWLYHYQRIMGEAVALVDGKIMICGKGWLHDYDEASYPKCMVLDTTKLSIVEFDSFYSDSIMNFINNVKNAGLFVSSSVASYKGGFAIVSMGPEVFLLNKSGILEKVIRDLPSGYTGFEKVRPFPKDVRRQSIQAITKWAKSWDYTDEHGIAVLGDTLLIVPRRVYGKPYYIDIYDLEGKKFVERIEAPGPIIGASNGKLFFADSLTANNAIISVYRFEEKGAYGKVTLNQVEDIRKAIDVESESACSGESGCCGTGDSYAHVQCSPDKLHKVDTIHTEDGKTVRVVCNYALSPDSIFQFCDGARKNMFVFLAPSDPLGLILLDTLASCLKPLNDWTLTCVICYPAPPDLDFLYGNIPSSQILVNRCVSIPDSTLALTDLGEPPAAIALSEGGKTLIAGYSWAPGYDEQKGGDGISFTEFLEQCAITRHTK